MYRSIMVMLALGSAAFAQEMPADYAAVLKTLGRQGDLQSNVLKVNIPRNDLKVTIDGIATPAGFGFGGWIAMTKGDGGHDVMMGDLVLLEDEVNPVMSAYSTTVWRLQRFTITFSSKARVCSTCMFTDMAWRPILRNR